MDLGLTSLVQSRRGHDLTAWALGLFVVWKLAFQGQESLWRGTEASALVLCFMYSLAGCGVLSEAVGGRERGVG